MPLIDERGRFFGRINLIDAMVGLFVLVLIPLGYGAFALFRPSLPTVTSVKPAQIAENETATLEVVGTNFRPFMNAYFGSQTQIRGAQQVTIFVESPTKAWLTVPNTLVAGIYDLILADNLQDLLRQPVALTVVALPAPPPPPPPIPPVFGSASVRVHFVVRPEMVDMLKVGDADLLADTGVAAEDRAVLTSIASERPTVNALTDVVTGSPRQRYQVPQILVTLVATLRVPIVKTTTGWQYRDQPIKPGAMFSFEAGAGFMQGWIADVTVAPRSGAGSR